MVCALCIVVFLYWTRLNQPATRDVIDNQENGKIVVVVFRNKLQQIEWLDNK